MQRVVLLLSAVGAVLLLASGAALVAFVEPAEASFPGNNGKIVYMSSSEGAYYDIFVMNVDGSEKSNLTNTSDAMEASPAWSPDGSRIAYSRNGDLWVMDADGSGQRRLTTTPAPETEGHPAWSPDGSKIAFSRTLGNGSDDEILVMDADGSNQRRLTHTADNPDTWGASDIEPVFSLPGGKKIAFSSARLECGYQWGYQYYGCPNEHYDVWVMNATDGSEATPLTDTPEYDPAGSDRFNCWVIG
jgi:Tol biopolymer transport system component